MYGSRHILSHTLCDDRLMYMYISSPGTATTSNHTAAVIAPRQSLPKTWLYNSYTVCNPGLGHHDDDHRHIICGVHDDDDDGSGSGAVWLTGTGFHRDDAPAGGGCQRKGTGRTGDVVSGIAEAGTGGGWNGSRE